MDLIFVCAMVRAGQGRVMTKHCIVQVTQYSASAFHWLKCFVTTAFSINSNERMQTLYRAMHSFFLERKEPELVTNDSSDGASVVMKLYAVCYRFHKNIINTEGHPKILTISCLNFVVFNLQSKMYWNSIQRVSPVRKPWWYIS